MGYQRGAFALGYVDDMREPLDWLYNRPSVPSTFRISSLRSKRDQADRELPASRVTAVATTFGGASWNRTSDLSIISAAL